MNARCAVDFDERVYADESGDADAREDAIDAASDRINAELQAEFRRGFAGEAIEMRHAVRHATGMPLMVGWACFEQALSEVMLDPAVGDALIDATKAPMHLKGEKLERFITVAANRWAADHADELAELEVDKRRYAS